MPVAIPYIRFSTSDQQHGDSERRQRERLDRWLADHPDYTVPDRYEDRGLSGFSGKNIDEGNLGRLLAAVREGTVAPGTVILVEALDRFSRLPASRTIAIVAEIVGAGVVLLTLEDNTWYDSKSINETALLTLAIKAQTAHDYSRRLSDRITKSYAGRAVKAKASQTIKRRNGFWLTSDGKLIDGAKEVVQSVFKMFTDGVPIKQIVRAYPDYLKNPASCRHLLRNPATMGDWQRTTTEIIDGKKKRVDGERIAGVFEPAVDAATYFQAQQLLDKTSNPGFTTARKFFMAGLFYCVECEAKMHLLKAGPNSVTDRLRCSTHVVNPSACSNGTTIPVPIAKFFFSHTSTVFAYKGFKDSRIPELQRRKIEVQGRLGNAEREIRATEAKMDIDPDNLAYRAELKERTQRRNNLKLELASIAESPASADLNIFELGSAMVAHTNGEEHYPLMAEFTDYMKSHDPLSINMMLQLGGYGVWVREDGLLLLKDVSLFPPDHIPYWCSLEYLGYNRKAKAFEVYYQDKKHLINGDGISVSDTESNSIKITIPASP